MPTRARIARQLGGQRLVLDRGAQRHQPEIEEEQDQHRRQPRVPHPVGAPHRLAPQRAGHQRQERERRAERRRRLGRHVGQRMAEHQSPKRRDRDQRVYTIMASQAHGTWMNMILTVSPC